MTSTEAIEFISSVLAEANPHTKFEVYEVDIPGYGTPTIPNPILIEVAGSYDDEKAYGLNVIHPDKELDDAGKQIIRHGTILIAIEIINELKSLRRAKQLAAAAKNN